MSEAAKPPTAPLHVLRPRALRPTGRGPCSPAGPPSGHVELVVDGEHFTRIVRDGILTARTSLDIATADFKAMLIPEPGVGYRRRAASIVETFRRLAAGGAEIRLLHAGTPSSAALRELKEALP